MSVLGRIDELERSIRMLVQAPTVPIYDPTNLPQDSVTGQIAVGSDASFNWFGGTNWRTQAGTPSTVGNVPQDMVDGQIAIGTDGSFHWAFDGTWYTAAFQSSTIGNVPQDVLKGQIAIGNDSIASLHWYDGTDWHTFGVSTQTGIFIFDPTSSAATAVKTLSGLTPPFYSQFDLYVPSASEAIMNDPVMGNFGGPDFLRIAGNWDGIFRFRYHQPSHTPVDGTVLWTGLSNSNAFDLPLLPLDTWVTVTFAVNGSTTITWKIDSTLIDSYTTTFDPPNDNWFWGAGMALDDPPAGAFFYLRNISVGTSPGAGDIFAPASTDDFDSVDADFQNSTGP